MYTKKQLENILHRRLMWHEYADKGVYIAGGKFDSADPIEIIVHYDPDKVERCHVKCAGIPEMMPLEKFSSGAQCSKCLERATLSMHACSASSSMLQCDLTVDFAEKQRVCGRVTVPAGCPHAADDAAVSDDERREYKYWAHTFYGPKHSKQAIPYSWKIVETQDKLTLSIQYRIRYLDGNNMDTVCSSMYCHISCNLRTGMSYMSDIHSGKSHLRSGCNHIETLTFSNEFRLLYFMPEYQKLKEPLTALYETLRKKLGEEGFSCRLLAKPLNATWQVPVPSETKFKNIEELLRDIAILNRFPNLGEYALPHALRSVVSLYIRRRFDRLPRAVSAGNLADALELPDTPRLREIIEKEPSKAVFAVMLHEWGFPSEDIEEFAADRFENVAEALRQIVVPEQNKHGRNYEMFDMLSITMPIRLLLDRGIRAPIEDSFDMLLDADSISVMTGKISEAEMQMLKPFRKMSSQWAGTADAVRFSWEPHKGSISSIRLSSKDEELVRMSVAMTMYLDRRCWNRKEAEKLVQWVKAVDAASEDEATQELGEHVSSTFLRAVRFSSELLNTESLALKARSERECKVVYEWAYKNGVEVSLSVDELYGDARSVRKSIEKRLENKRKAKRDAKTQK